MSTRPQPGAPRLTPTAIVMLRANPSNCVLAHIGLTPLTNLHCSGRWVRLCSRKNAHDSQSPRICSRPSSGPVTFKVRQKGVIPPNGDEVHVPEVRPCSHKSTCQHSSAPGASSIPAVGPDPSYWPWSPLLRVSTTAPVIQNWYLQSCVCIRPALPTTSACPDP